MGIKGLSANDTSSSRLRAGLARRRAQRPAPGTPRGPRHPQAASASTALARGWLHKSIIENAADICLEKAGSHGHRAVFVRHLQQLLHTGMEVVVVLDGDPARWPVAAEVLNARFEGRGAINGRWHLRKPRRR